MSTTPYENTRAPQAGKTAAVIEFAKNHKNLSCARRYLSFRLPADVFDAEVNLEQFNMDTPEKRNPIPT